MFVSVAICKRINDFVLQKYAMRKIDKMRRMSSSHIIAIVQVVVIARAVL